MSDEPLPDRPADDQGGALRPLLTYGLLAAALLCWGLDWGLPHPVSFAKDVTVFGRAEADGERPWRTQAVKYPPLHFVWREALVFAPLRRGIDPAATHEDRAWPFLLAGRAVSAAMGWVAGLLTVLLGWRLGTGRWGGVLAGLLFVGAPLSAYYARTTNLELPYVMWSMLALYGAVRFVDAGRTRWLWLFFGAAALAIGTKDQAYGLFPGPGVLVLAELGRRRRPDARWLGRLTAGLLAPALWGGLGLLAVLYAAPYAAAGGVAAFGEHLAWITGQGVDQYRQVESTARGLLSLLAGIGVAGWELLTPLGAAAVVTAVVAALIGRSDAADLRPVRWLAAAGLGYVGLFLLPIRFVLPRFLLPLMPLVWVAVVAGWRRGWLRWPRVTRSIAGLIVVAVLADGVALVGALMLDPRRVARLDLGLRQEIGHLEPGTAVGLLGMRRQARYRFVDGRHQPVAAWRDWSAHGTGLPGPGFEVLSLLPLALELFIWQPEVVVARQDELPLAAHLWANALPYELLPFELRRPWHPWRIPEYDPPVLRIYRKNGRDPQVAAKVRWWLDVARSELDRPLLVELLDRRATPLVKVPGALGRLIKIARPLLQADPAAFVTEVRGRPAHVAQLAALMLGQVDRREAARQVLTAALTRRPAGATALIKQLAELERASGAWDAARERLGAALAADPTQDDVARALAEQLLDWAPRWP